MKYLFICSFLVFTACKQNNNSPISVAKEVVSSVDASKEIKAVFKAQQEAWNRADIPGFMKGYWNSPELSFIGSKGLTRGWQTTMDNYIKSYPDEATMGKLSFDVLELRRLSDACYYMIGKYTLTRAEDEPSGYFNLVWEKKDGSWVVTSDHTS